LHHTRTFPDALTALIILFAMATIAAKTIMIAIDLIKIVNIITTLILLILIAIVAIVLASITIVNDNNTINIIIIVATAFVTVVVAAAVVVVITAGTRVPILMTVSYDVIDAPLRQLHPPTGCYAYYASPPRPRAATDARNRRCCKGRNRAHDGNAAQSAQVNSPTSTAPKSLASRSRAALEAAGISNAPRKAGEWQGGAHGRTHGHEQNVATRISRNWPRVRLEPK